MAKKNIVKFKAVWKGYSLIGYTTKEEIQGVKGQYKLREDVKSMSKQEFISKHLKMMRANQADCHHPVEDFY